MNVVYKMQTVFNTHARGFQYLSVIDCLCVMLNVCLMVWDYNNHGRSTSTRLLNILDEWIEYVENGGPINVIKTDFSEAFDKVHKPVILKYYNHKSAVNVEIIVFLWNELPTDLREPRQTQSPSLSPITHGISSSSSLPSSRSPFASSLTRSVFHSELKTWLFTKSFPP